VCNSGVYPGGKEVYPGWERGIPRVGERVSAHSPSLSPSPVSLLVIVIPVSLLVSYSRSLCTGAFCSGIPSINYPFHGWASSRFFTLSRFTVGHAPCHPFHCWSLHWALAPSPRMFLTFLTFP